jgi:hypothetical protein
MSRLFFQLRDGTDNLLDPEGVELPNLEAVIKRTLQCAYGIMANDVGEGKLKLDYRIDVEDEAGKVVYVARFRDLVKITGLEAA